MSYAKHLGTTQLEQRDGTVPNSGGGFSFPVDDWTRLERFLILGAEGGSYYATERTLTKENAGAVQRCLAEDGLRVVRTIVEVSEGGRAPKNEPALFALALAAKYGASGAPLVHIMHDAGAATRRAALEALPRVARIGTHLFHFAEYVKALGGWGRATKRAVADWYLKMPPAKLALQAIKYQQRDGWAHRDILRKAHPIAMPDGGTHDGALLHQQATTSAILNWMVKGWPSVGEEIHPQPGLVQIWAFERARTLRGGELAKLILEYRLPHECVPNEAKGDPSVWDAMLPSMGLTAMIRNLGKMTAVGLLRPMTAAAGAVVDRLGDPDQLFAARVHPLALLVAQRVYAQGHGDKGKLTWSPVQQIVDALDAAFYTSFKAVEPTGKRTMLALDISGSMGSPDIAGMSGISPRVGSAAMALVTANVEQYVITGFHANGLMELKISPRQRLDDVIKTITGLPFGATDCALPFAGALKARIPVDTFVVYTDSETNQNSKHPVDALREYRQKTGIAAKLVVVGMVSNDFSIADPADGGMLDVVGFDTAAPAVISDFSRGGGAPVVAASDAD